MVIVVVGYLIKFTGQSLGGNIALIKNFIIMPRVYVVVHWTIIVAFICCNV